MDSCCFKLVFKLLFIFLALLNVQLSFSQSNVGTEFWLSFMEHVDAGDNNMVVMISSTVNTTGTVSLPNLNFSTDFSVNANDVTLINLPQEAETIGSGRVNRNAIHIVSESPVTVYMHQFSQWRSEASVVLPVDALSREYFALCYTGIDVFRNSGESELVIVATRDETTVNIFPSEDTSHGVNKGEQESIQLNQGETYQLRVNNANQDLTGSFISADKDIAVFAGASWAGVPMSCGTYDNLLEQMSPIDTWGSRYITVPMKDIDDDVFRILAASDNTEISVVNARGNTREYNLDRGEFVEYAESESTFIEADKPILVAQYLTGRDCSVDPQNGDPSMVILNTVEQTRDTVSVFNSSLQNIVLNYIIIIARSADVNNISLDGQALDNSQWSTVGDLGDFSFARIRVNAGPHTIISEGCGVIAMSFGLGDAESYAYSGGANFTKINANPIPDGGCVGLPIEFDSGLSPERYDVEWDLGNGTIVNDHSFSYTYPERIADYTVSLSTYDICFDEFSQQEKLIKVTFREQVEADIDSILLCEDESFSLGAMDVGEATYEWSGPKDFFEEIQYPAVTRADPSQSGIYEVIGIVFGCATFPDFVKVDVIPEPEPFLGVDSVICTRGGSTHILRPGEFSAYDWSDGTTTGTFEVKEAGEFIVTVLDENGCMGQDTILLEPQCPTEVYMANAFAPLSLNDNNTFGLGIFSAMDIIEMEFAIYDRWGNLLFESKDPSERWNGTLNDDLVDAGSYVWKLNYTGFDEVGDTFSESLTGTVLVVY